MERLEAAAARAREAESRRQALQRELEALRASEAKLSEDNARLSARVDGFLSANRDAEAKIKTVMGNIEAVIAGQ